MRTNRPRRGAFIPPGLQSRLTSTVLGGRKLTPSSREEGPPYLPKRATGCVKLRDQIRLVERILGFCWR